MRLFVLQNDSIVDSRQFDRPPVTIGAGDHCHVRLHDAQVAPEQLRLRTDAVGGWIVEPLDSRFPARLNGQPLQQARPLKDLDEIGVGSFVLKCYFGLSSRGGGDSPSGVIHGAGGPGASRPTESSGAVQPATGSGTIRTAGGSGSISPETRAVADVPLPPGSIVRTYATGVKLSPARMHEAATFAAELSSVAGTDAMVDHVLAHLLKSFHGAIAGVRVRHRTAAGLELVRAIDAKGRRVEVPVLCDAMQERCMRQLFRVCVPNAERPGVGSVLAVPIVGSRDVVLGMIYLETARPDPAFGHDLLDAFTAIAAAFARPLERAIRGEQTARTEQAAHELTTARRVQELITPRAMPEWPEYHLGVYRRPGHARCRDFYDIVRLANKTAALLVARIDADGASLLRLMSETRSAFRISCLHADAPHVVLRAINWLIGETPDHAIVHVCCAWIDPESAAMKIASAGTGVTVGAVTSDGRWRATTHAAQPAIGKARGFAFNSHADSLEPGGTLALLTEGVDTLLTSEGSALKTAGVIDLLRDAAGSAVNMMLSDVGSEIDQIASTGTCPDDITILLAQRST